MSNQKNTYLLRSIYFYLTSGCNLACRHCWITPTFQAGEHLSLALFQSIVEQAKPLGLTSVKLTGGEPLFHPQIKKILQYIKEQRLTLTIETNGVLATPELCVAIKECQGAFVSVSLDAADAETHEWVRGVKGCFAGAIQGIKNLVAAGLSPQLIMSVMRRNRDQLAAVVRLAEELGCGSVKFNLVQPTARGQQMHERGETLSIEELVALGRWVEQELSQTTTLKLYFSHPAALRPLGKLFGRDGDGCSVCGVLGIIGVLGSGKYALCGIGETVPELVFGDASTDQLAEVWRHNPLLRQIREGLPEKLEGVCRECALKKQCLGNCLAQNYYSAKNLFAAHWYCEQAQERGLFPTSRILSK